MLPQISRKGPANDEDEIGLRGRFSAATGRLAEQQTQENIERSALDEATHCWKASRDVGGRLGRGLGFECVLGRG